MVCRHDRGSLQFAAARPLLGLVVGPCLERRQFKPHDRADGLLGTRTVIEVAQVSLARFLDRVEADHRLVLVEPPALLVLVDDEYRPGPVLWRARLHESVEMVLVESERHPDVPP